MILIAIFVKQKDFIFLLYKYFTNQLFQSNVKKVSPKIAQEKFTKTLQKQSIFLQL